MKFLFHLVLTWCVGWFWRNGRCLPRVVLGCEVPWHHWDLASLCYPKSLKQKGVQSECPFSKKSSTDCPMRLAYRVTVHLTQDVGGIHSRVVKPK